MRTAPRQTTRRATRRLVAALAVLLALLTLSGCTVAMPSTHRQIHITAYFSSAAGVFVGNDVGILGVPVGRIDSIQPAGSRVKVVMSVDAGTPVPADAEAVVVPRSVATDRYIELTPAYHSGPRLRDGAVIGLSRTRVPVEFDQVLATLDRFATGIAGHRDTRQAVRRFLETGSNALRGKGQLINHTIKSLGAATDGISGQRRNGEATLVALDRLTGKLAANQHTVRRFIKQVGRASALLASERKDFRNALDNVTSMIRVVARFARNNRGRIRRAVHQTSDVMRTVLDKRSKVAEILRETPLAMQNLRRTRTPQGRLRVRLDPTQLTPVLAPVTKALCAVPALGRVCDHIGLDPTQLLDLLGALGGAARQAEQPQQPQRGGNR